MIRSEEHVPRKMVLDAIAKFTDAANEYVMDHDRQVQDDLERVAICGWNRSRLLSELPGDPSDGKGDYIDAILEAAGAAMSTTPTPRYSHGPTHGRASRITAKAELLGLTAEAYSRRQAPLAELLQAGLDYAAAVREPPTPRFRAGSR
jgi:hypothetical protein